MTKREKINLICLIIFIGFCVSVLYHLSVNLFTNLGYPYDTLLFRPEDQFGDFLDNFNIGRLPYGEIKPSRATMPFFVLLCSLMSLGVAYQGIILALYTIAFLFGLALLIRYFLKEEPAQRRSIIVLLLLFCTYPVLISLDRANFENGIFLLIFASLLCFRQKKYVMAAILMGVAIAIKPYSIFFLPFFLLEGQIVSVIIAVTVAVLLSLGSLFLLPLPMQEELTVLGTNFGLYNGAYVTGNEGLYFGTSLFGALKLMVYLLGDALNLFTSSDQVLAFNQSIQRPYFWLTNLAFAAVVLFLLRFRGKPWEISLVLTACLTWLPFVGSAYRLLYWFIPLMLFVVEPDQDRSDRFHAILFGLLMIPTSYIHFSADPIFMLRPGEASDSVLFQPAIIGILLVSVLVRVYRRGQLNDVAMKLFERLRVQVLRTKKAEGES